MKKNTNALTAEKINRKKKICVRRPPDTYYGSADYFQAVECLTKSGFIVLQYYLQNVSLTIMTEEKKRFLGWSDKPEKSYRNGLDNLFDIGFIRAINEDTYLLDYKAKREMRKVG